MVGNVNAWLWASAVKTESVIFLKQLMSDNLFIGFLAGAVALIFVVGFVLSKDPRHIPFILRYSFPECFVRVRAHYAKCQRECLLSVEQFNQVYLRVRILFFGSIFLLFVLLASLVFTLPLA